MVAAKKQLKPKNGYTRETMDNLLWQGQVGGECDIVTNLGSVTIEGFGPEIWLAIKSHRARVAFELTSFTVQELAVLKETLDNVFALAAQVSLGRDKKAEELTNAGTNLTFRRLYRPVPQVITGPGARGIDGASLLNRPVDVTNEEV